MTCMIALSVKYDFYQLKGHKNFEIARGKDRKEVPYFPLENLSINKLSNFYFSCIPF